VDVTVVAIDEAQRRIGLSMVEMAKRERDADEARSRSEEDSALGRLNEQRSLGTLADLLAASKRGGAK
jgi:transcriptional accessory protein Tex/SPT6